jgi:gluconokinase
MVQPTPTPAPSSTDRLLPNSAPNGTASHHHLFIVTGPAGCGKSTVGQFIAKTMSLPFVEGDEVRENKPLLYSSFLPPSQKSPSL